MPYTAKDWAERLQYRSDLTFYLTHLTRRTPSESAVEVLLKILAEGKLNQSSHDSKFIIGNKGAVCFQNVPLQSIRENLRFENYYRGKYKVKSIRYDGVGLRIPVIVAYKNGARPVIYGEPYDLKAILPEREYWRIVRYDLSKVDSIVDWSHEREWRVPGGFKFKFKYVGVVLSNSKDYKEFMEKGNDNIVKKIQGIVCLDALST